MSPINAYLMFDGNAAEAMRFYEQVLHGKMETFMTYGEAPATDTQAPEGCAELLPGSENRVMHACLNFGDGLLMASDTMVGQPHEPMKGISLALSCASNDEARRVFEAFAAGGTVVMPLAKTFWAELFGVVTDRFGTPWMVNGKRM